MKGIDNSPNMILYALGGVRRFLFIIKVAFKVVKPSLIIKGNKSPDMFERPTRVKLKFMAKLVFE